MANFNDLKINSIVKIADPSFLRGVYDTSSYKDTIAIVIGKDEGAQTVLLELFDLSKKWAKASRVSECLEILE